MVIRFRFGRHRACTKNLRRLCFIELTQAIMKISDALIGRVTHSTFTACISHLVVDLVNQVLHYGVERLEHPPVLSQSD